MNVYAMEMITFDVTEQLYKYIIHKIIYNIDYVYMCVDIHVVSVNTAIRNS